MSECRVAVLGTRGFPGVQGGVEQHGEQLYARLVKRGFDVTVFIRPSYFDPVPQNFKGVRLVPLRCPRNKNLEAIVHSFRAALQVTIHRADFDLVHVHSIGPALVIPLLRWSALPIVMTHHGPDYERQKWGFLAQTLLRFGERFACRQAHAIIAIAEYMRESLRMRCGDRITYIPNGVLRVDPPSAAALDRWSLVPRGYVVAVARWVPEKGLHDIVEAWGKVVTNKTLVLVGGADHNDRYARELKGRVDRAERVIATGTVSSDVLAGLYVHACGFVQPSYHEGLPLTLLDALNYGIPVAVSDIPAHRELITDAKIRVQPGDVSAWVDQMQALVDADTFPDLDPRLQRRLQDEYNWDRIADRTAEVYRSVLREVSRTSNS